MYMKNMKKPRNVTRRKRGTRTKQRGGFLGDFKTGDAAEKTGAAALNVQNAIKKTAEKAKTTAEKAKNKFFDAFKGIFGNNNQPPAITNPAPHAIANAPHANPANPQLGGLKRKHRTKRYRKGTMNKRTKRAKRTRSRK